MPGTLYVIGVGPGDPELMTLKAARIVRDVPVLFVPKGREEGTSLALSIVSGAIPLDGKDIVETHFPMKKTREKEHGRDLERTWNGICDSVLSRLDAGKDAAFITLGDPTVYSTFFYLYDRLLERKPGLNIEIVPGVSSINAASCSAKTVLGLADDKIAILPATYTDDLRPVLSDFDAVVLMKVHRVFERVLTTLEDMGLAGTSVYVCRVGMKDEKIKAVKEVKEEDLDYFSMIIVRKRP